MRFTLMENLARDRGWAEAKVYPDGYPWEKSTLRTEFRPDLDCCSWHLDGKPVTEGVVRMLLGATVLLDLQSEPA